MRQKSLIGVSVFLVIAFLFTSMPTSSQGVTAENPPPGGFVPNEETAIRIAVAVWIPIYGEAKIKEQAPYEATLNGDEWIVSGSLPAGENGPIMGGVAKAHISKKSGCILRVVHGM